MNVFILETSYPKDFYNEQLDGLVARNLLNTMGIENTLKLVVDKEYFENLISYTYPATAVIAGSLCVTILVWTGVHSCEFLMLFNIIRLRW